MTIRMRVLPRFPATISATNGLKVERPTGSPNLIFKPDFGSLVQIPSVDDPENVFFIAWDKLAGLYRIMSFSDLFAGVADLGFMQVAVYDPQGKHADAFARANHTGVQAISTVSGLQTALDAKLSLSGGTMTGPLNAGGFAQTNLSSLNGGPLNNFRNKLINGDFDVWTRALTQTTSGYGSDDRWNNEHSGSAKTVSQQLFSLGQALVPGNPKFFSRTVVTSVAGAGNFVRKTQRIESVRSFSGKTITLTLSGAADANRNIAIELVQNFGTGGSPSSPVTGIGSQLVAMTTAMAKKSITIAVPSIATKTLGSNGDDYLEVVIWCDAGSTFSTRAATLGQQSGTFDLAHISLVEGDATKEDDPFSSRHYQQELALCERYYQLVTVSIAGPTTGTMIVPWYCSTPMRKTPSLAVTTTGSVSGMTITADTVSNNKAGYLQTSIVSAGGFTIGRVYGLDAEL